MTKKGSLDYLITFDPFWTGYLLGFLSKCIELRLLEPEPAWRMMRPFLIKMKEDAKKDKVRMENLGKGMIRLYDEGSAIVRESFWYDDFVYGNEEIPIEPPSFLVDKYVNATWEDVLNYVQDKFIKAELSLYSLEEVINRFTKYVESIKAESKRLNLGLEDSLDNLGAVFKQKIYQKFYENELDKIIEQKDRK